MSGIVPAAFMLDLVAGEPPVDWHPVCWMGRAVSLAETALLNEGGGDGRERLAGAVAALALPALTFILARRFLKELPGSLSGAVEMALLSASLAGRSLYDASRSVEHGLAVDIDMGRRSASCLVGRDTGQLDEAGVVRAAIESVAENANDGVVAPMFYGVIGGAPLALAYKMINTLDSMVGYRNRRYQSFGWAAARLDDAAGYLPARLTGLAVIVASPLAGARAGGAWAVWRRDAGRHRSPNAGVCESAFAGALGVRLGGDNVYDGEIVAGAELGAGLPAPARGDIGRAARLMYTTAAIAMAVATLAQWFIRRWVG